VILAKSAYWYPKDTNWYPTDTSSGIKSDTHLKATPKQPLLQKQTSKQREANDKKQTFVFPSAFNSKPFASLTTGKAKASR
jgi:hypothetical protein